MNIKFKKIHPKAKLPKYALPGDAGMDLFACEKIIIKSGQIATVDTGFEIELPAGTVGLIWDKSGIATKHGIKTVGGVWDESYRGGLIISLINLSNKDYIIETGDKIAQLLVQKIEHPTIVETDELTETIRGKGRLGSTGKK